MNLTYKKHKIIIKTSLSFRDKDKKLKTFLNTIILYIIEDYGHI